ncbi:hypothetical protein SECTIM467_23 [Brevibacillus phage SecTim467]|uniref:Portal protein n=2 Tax=Jenstvirus jenst TaxID=1982225 RepID=A0A0K2CP66_9CAUD|nr:portal protein [Brevibacillus phage Jenst]ALA07153.1 hypothetical protein JENST_23 [Brevibacillus phage Jenst]ALA07523.1 hypothetical protein SECTIM467_23 [Brevibacillus phage SecTim467]
MGFFKNLFSRVTSFFAPQSKSQADERQVEQYAERLPVDTFGGSRKTKTIGEGSVSRTTKYKNLTEQSFGQYSPKTLLNLLKYNHPDVSQAIWNFKIIGNSGYKAKVTLLDGTTEHKSGQKLIADFLLKLDYYNSDGFEKSRSIDRLVDMLFDSALLRGAVSLEMVMDRDYKDVLYFASVDPDTIDFKVENNRLVPYQSAVKLDIPTFFYEGIDETETDPYGTSPFISVIQTLAFHMQVLEDIKMVVHNQGYGKYDIKIIEEVLLKRMPINIRNNEAKKQQWLNDQLDKIIEMYSKLDPDAAFVHFDSVEVDMVETAKATIDPQKLMAVIDTQILGALKQYSTLMGRRSQGQTEQYAKLEIKIFMKSVKKIRDVIEQMLSRALTKYLNIHGMQGYVFFKFNDTEIRTELEQVNFEQIAIQNAEKKVANGWLDNDMASEEITGHKAVGEPDRERLGIKANEAKGAQDERTPNDSSSSDSTGN